MADETNYYTPKDGEYKAVEPTLPRGKIVGTAGDDDINETRNHIDIDAGDGNDHIKVGRDVKAPIQEGDLWTIIADVEDAYYSVHAGAGDDHIHGQGGGTAFGGKGDDLITSFNTTTMDAILMGGEGNDTIINEGGKATMIGGEGNDTFIVNAEFNTGTDVRNFAKGDKLEVLLTPQEAAALVQGDLQTTLKALNITLESAELEQLNGQLVRDERTNNISFVVR